MSELLYEEFDAFISYFKTCVCIINSCIFKLSFIFLYWKGPKAQKKARKQLHEEKKSQQYHQK